MLSIDEQVNEMYSKKPSEGSPLEAPRYRGLYRKEVAGVSEMDLKDVQYFADGLSTTMAQYSGEIYKTLVVKGKKRMGQETREDSPQISELVKRTRESQTISELVSKGKQGQDELISSIGSEVKKMLTAAGIVTKTDLARIEKRMDEIEEALESKGR